MISGKQLKQVLDYSFTNGSSFLGASCTFIATPSTYTTTSVPVNVPLTGIITPNDALNISWTITDPSNSVLQSGIGNTPSYTLTGGDIPTTVGSFVFTLNVTYEDSLGNTYSVSCPTTIGVEVAASYGQLPGPGDNIVIPGDLTAPIEASFTTTTQTALMNLFSYAAAVTARMVIVVPDAYGTAVSITDNTSSDITAQFNVVVDAPNNRKIYVSNSTITPGTYYFQVNF